MSTRLLILTSRKNYSWVSMEEIISWIEQSWESWAQSRHIPYKIINVDDDSLSSIARAALTSDKIIVTCFNTSIAGALRFLRYKLSIQIPWVYYLHGLASYGCWPLFKWQIGQLIHSGDLFIGSCHRDRDQFDLVFRNIETRTIPFSLNLERKIPAPTVPSIKKFVFIGRLSSQKNLHTLLLALKILQNTFEDKSWEMHFFGKADNYGSPLMGRREEHYDSYLEELAENLGIAEKVFFHGFVKREKIQEMMDGELWTFIAPSIHSDENFGMAAFRSLLNGHHAILSDWGGHGDFPAHFQSVSLLTVRSSEIGPYIDPFEMAKLMYRHHPSAEAPFPNYYSQKFIHQQYDQIWQRQTEDTQPVQTTTLLDEILKRQERYFKLGSDGSRIFEDYRDPLMNIFFKAYGQKDKIQKKPPGEFQLVPWVGEDEEKYLVKDPHRGDFKLSKDKWDRASLSYLGLSYPLLMNG